MDQVRLNLGCGHDIRPDFVNVDFMKVAGVDMVVDLNGALPWQNDSVDYVYMSHVLEHLKDPAYSLEEIHRILKPGAIAQIIVPHRKHTIAYSIYHTRYFDENSFVGFCTEDVNAQYGLRFQIVERRIFWDHRILKPWHMKKYLKVDVSKWPWGTPKEVSVSLKKNAATK